MSSLKTYFLNLNIFVSSPDDNEQLDVQQRRIYIIATRIYFLILISVLIIVGIVSLLVQQTIIVTIQHPSIDQFIDLPYDANCPCSQISFPYGAFMSIETSFHQVCSSDFVSDRWIKTISSDSNSTYFYFQDFRTYGSAQFQALASFCRLSITTVQQEIASYMSNSLISPQVFSPAVLVSLTYTSISQFRLTMLNDSGAQLQLIRQMTVGNRLISGLQTNKIQIYENIGDDLIRIGLYSVQYQNNNKSFCDCTTDLDCVGVSGIFDIFNPLTQFDLGDNFTWIKVPGIVSGCLPVDSILLSTLECFYNQTCIDQLITYFPTTEQFTTMNDSATSRFSSSSTVQSIIDQLMIEYWITDVSYEGYYHQCAPISCTYTKLERNSFVFILTQLISILGGLTILLGFIIPIPIRSIQRPLNIQQSPQTSRIVRLCQIKTMIFKTVLELNWFKHHPSNDRQIRYQRYATRLYVLLVISTLVIMIFYISLSQTTYRQTILNPTQSQYLELQQSYFASLVCPCSSISIDYSTFIDIQPQYHQICSSDLISSLWINYLSMNLHWNDILLPWDYRILSSTLFKSLAMFCQEAKQTIDNSLHIFHQRKFITSKVVPEQVFQRQVQSLTQDWRRTTISQYLHTMQLIRATTHGNQLMNDINFDYQTNITSRKTILKSLTSSQCSCALSSLCRTNMAIYQYDPYTNNTTEVYSIPDFFLSCLPIEGLLASTLVCFYNRSCMMEIDKYMYQSLGEAFLFSPLDENLNEPTENIELILDQLMVDEWITNTSFISYYHECAPQSCAFEYNGRKDLFSVITTIIGVFGGLSFALELFVLMILRLVEKIVIIHFPRFNVMNFIKNLVNCNNEQRLIKQLHFVLVVGSLSTLYMFTTFTSRLITVEIKNPTLNTFEDLLTRFPMSLQCPCSQISIKYGSFLSITPTFHPVCQSDFVSSRWFVYLADQYTPTDFQYSTIGQFQLLASLCQLSQETINYSLINLVTDNFISANLLPTNSLMVRSLSIISEFIETTPKSFLSTLSLIRETTRANMIMTTLSTNWLITTPSVIINGSTAHTVPRVYEECSCALSSNCVQSSRNMSTGCYPLEALLQSTFECLYDQQCIDPTNIFQAMNISELNHFQMNTNVESIINELMVETYSTGTFYFSYFTECAPSSCRYSYIEHNNILQGITSLISLYGGLLVICRSVAVLIVKLLQRRRRRVNPIAD